MRVVARLRPDPLGELTARFLRPPSWVKGVSGKGEGEGREEGGERKERKTRNV